MRSALAAVLIMAVTPALADDTNDMISEHLAVADTVFHDKGVLECRANARRSAEEKAGMKITAKDLVDVWRAADCGKFWTPAPPHVK